jgi:hypothetical protein
VARHAADNEAIRRRYFPDRPSLFDDDFSAYPEEGGAPGTGCRTCEPADLAVGPGQAVTPGMVREAYQVILGRRPWPGEIARAQRSAGNIAHLYALLLDRTREPTRRRPCDHSSKAVACLR